MKIKIYEIANPESVVSTAEMKYVPGNGIGGVDFDSGWRISEAYAKAGKIMGNFLEGFAFTEKGQEKIKKQKERARHGKAKSKGKKKKRK